jgi:hypothetical protein
MALDQNKQVASEKGAYSEDLQRLSNLDLLAATVNALLWSGMKGQGPKKQGLANIATVAVAKQKDGSLVFAFNDHSLENMPYVSPNFQNKNPLQDVGALSRLDSVEDLAGAPDQTISYGKGGKQVNVSMQVDGKWKKYIYMPKFTSGDIVFSPKTAIQEFVQELYLNNLVPKPPKVFLLNPTNKAEEHAEMRLVKYCPTVSKIGVSKPCCDKCAQTLDDRGIAYTRWSLVASMKAGWTPPDQINDTNDTKQFQYN